MKSSNLPGRRWSAGLVVLALALTVPALHGCGGGSEAPKSGSGGSNTLRLAQLTEPTTLDPALVRDGPTIDLLMQVFEGLVQWNEKNEVSPGLAEKWDVSKDGLTYTFHLRKGVRFHNSRPLTAPDFVYSLTRSLSPALNSPVAMSYLDDLAGAKAYNAGTAKTLDSVTAPDDLTLKLTIDKPKAYFLAKLTYPTAYAVCKEAIEAEGGAVNERSMTGTGAFKVAEYRRGDRIVLDANPDYWEGAPKLARMERRILMDAGTRHDKFEAGELDITDITMTSYKGDKANAELSPKLHEFERASVYYLALNQKAFAPFKDKRVRQAFAHAINKDQIIQTVHQGVPRKAEGILPYGMPGFDENLKGLQYDPAKAKQLLAEAGYPDGKGFPPLKLSFRAQMDDIRNTALAVASDLKTNLGIDVEMDESEWGSFLTRFQNKEVPFAFLRWAADYLDPQNFLSTLLQGKAPLNSVGYENTEFDTLCDAADVMQDPKQRMETYRKAERLAVDDAPWIPVFFQKDVELWNPKLRGVAPSLFGHLPHKRTYLEP